MPNGTYGGVRGGVGDDPTYSILFVHRCERAYACPALSHPSICPQIEDIRASVAAHAAGMTPGTADSDGQLKGYRSRGGSGSLQSRGWGTRRTAGE